MCTHYRIIENRKFNARTFGSFLPYVFPRQWDAWAATGAVGLAWAGNNQRNATLRDLKDVNCVTESLRWSEEQRHLRVLINILKIK